jgi:hypothetical protein
MASYVLPAKTFNYLRRLLLNYEHSGPSDLANVLKHGSVAVDVDTDRQHYNEGVRPRGLRPCIRIVEPCVGFGEQGGIGHDRLPSRVDPKSSHHDARLGRIA